MRGAERRQALVRKRRTRWPSSRIGRSPEIRPEIAGGIRPPARLSTLCCGVFLTASGRAFEQRRKRARHSSASSWQEAIVPPGGAPPPPEYEGASLVRGRR